MVKAENYWLWIVGGGLGKSGERVDCGDTRGRSTDCGWPPEHRRFTATDACPACRIVKFVKFVKFTMMQRDEDKLQMALWELICMRKKDGVLAWAVCNNPRNVIDGARYKRMGLVAGCPDLHFLVNGRFQALEVKTEKGKASLAQKAWMEALVRRGIQAEIGYGWDDCVEILQRRGVLLPGKYGKANAGPADKGPKKRKPAVRPSLEPGE